MPAFKSVLRGQNIDGLALLNELLQGDLLNEKQKKEVKKVLADNTKTLVEQAVSEHERQLKASKQQALVSKQRETAMRSHQERCLHLKYNEVTKTTETFLVGQFLQVPFAMLMLFCQDIKCQKIFSVPANEAEGWPLPPRELIPRRGIGGVGDISEMIRQHGNLNIAPPLKESEEALA